MILGNLKLHIFLQYVLEYRNWQGKRFTSSSLESLNALIETLGAGGEENEIEYNIRDLRKFLSIETA